MAGLVKQIDQVVARNSAKRVAAIVNFVGEPTDAYLEKVKAFGDKHAIQQVAITTTRDGDLFEISEDAEVTVMHYVEKTVKFNMAVGKGGLNDKAVHAIVTGIDTILD